MIIALIRRLIALIIAISSVVIPEQAQQSVPEGAQTYFVKVASFNVYVVDAGSITHANRENGVVATLRSAAPDVFGLQEADLDWVQRVTSAMPEYTLVGRGRGRKPDEGEFSPIFYLTEKYDLVSSGTFWYSRTPERSSFTWLSAQRRICTWAVLKDKESGFEFAVFNSHWDHLSGTSRRNSAELLLERANAYAPDIPVILTGDFNCAPDTLEYVSLIEGGFLDSAYVAPGSAPVSTYHAYAADENEGNLPIDHIFFKADSAYAQSCYVIKDKYDGMYPSDHFALVSELILYC